MTEVAWEALLALAAAFFFGAVLGCGLKRRFWYGRKSAASASPAAVAAVRPDASQPKVEVAARPAEVGDRFERSLSVAAAPAKSAPTMAAAAMAAPVAPAKVEPAKPAPAMSQPQAMKVEPAPPPPQAAAPQPAPRPAPPSPAAAPVKVEEGGAGPSDDLTRIRGIDPILQRRLKELGIRRFEDVARLTPADVKGLNETLDLKGRIDEENWTGQAQILETGGETYYSRRRDRGVPMPEAVSPAAPAPAMQAAKPARAVPAPVAAAIAPARAPASPAPAATAVESSAPSDFSHLRSVRSEALRGDDSARASGRNAGDIDDLKRIRGIGVLIEKKLNSLGITDYEQVANWTGADIERISRILDFKGRIEREHWIEQARILATGGETEFSRRG
jgi:predicted flap endonuclease-1-like 5' DNA nuclease